MLTIRCGENDKNKVHSVLKKYRTGTKKKNIDILMEALKIYEEYQERVKAKISKAVADVWGD
jgi:hypothetical protein